MALFLVRHAKAGSRSKWAGDDELRPLTKAGWAQAEALAEWLEAEIGVVVSEPDGLRPRLVSSPYVRCVETLEPLGKRLGTTVECDDRLAEGGWFDEALTLLDELSDRSVVCSHGDVIPDLIAGLERRGMGITGQIDWRKGSTWVVERDGGNYRSAYAVPPP
jgi:8-oxo-dGTP diphosphatase